MRACDDASQSAMHIVGTPTITVVRVSTIVASADEASKRWMTHTAAPTRNAETTTC